MKKEWILAKYLREEFTDPDRQSAYNCSYKEGILWKLGRDRRQFQQRKFVLSRAENKFLYYINDDSKQVGCRILFPLIRNFGPFFVFVFRILSSLILLYVWHAEKEYISFIKCCYALYMLNLLSCFFPLKEHR